MLLEQPRGSMALNLTYMKERANVWRAIVPQCAFGLRDPENGKPYQKYASLEVNQEEMAADIKAGITCQHGPGAHQTVEGTRVGDRILRAASLTLKGRDEPVENLALQASSLDRLRGG